MLDHHLIESAEGLRLGCIVIELVDRGIIKLTRFPEVHAFSSSTSTAHPHVVVHPSADHREEP